VVASDVTPADGDGERAAAVRMARSLPGSHRKTLTADKGYDTRDFMADIRIPGITPHGAQNIQARRRSAIDGRTARRQSYGKSINARERIGVTPREEECSYNDNEVGAALGKG
jgi:hypothetical protein